MARTKRSAKLDTRNARKKLKTGQMHQERLSTGQYIAYRKPTTGGAGTWLARWRNDAGKITQTRLGAADDFQDADGEEILTYPQAQARAIRWFKTRERQASLETDGEIAHKGPFTVSHALDAYLKDRQRLGMKTLTMVVNSAKAWIIPSLGHIEVSRLTRVKIENWLDAMSNSPKKRKSRIGDKQPRYAPPPKTDDEKRARKESANRMLTILKAALSFSVDRRLIDVAEQPWRLVKSFKGTRKARVRYLSVGEQVKLINACHGEFKSLVKGALLTGCRYRELTHLKCKDYNHENGTIFVAESKNGKPRHIYLTEEGRALFEELTAGRDPESLIFIQTWQTKTDREVKERKWIKTNQIRLLNEAYQKAGIEKVTFHELRHTYASTLVNRGCSLYVIAQQLGHAGTSMIEKHYGHLSPNTIRNEVMQTMPTLEV